MVQFYVPKNVPSRITVLIHDACKSRKLLQENLYLKVLVIALDETTEIVFGFHEKRLFIFLTLSKIDIDSNALS